MAWISAQLPYFYEKCFFALTWQRSFRLQPVLSPRIRTPTTPATDTSATSHEEHGLMAMLGPADANYNLRFIDGMRSHHQGAMAKVAQQKSQNPEIKQLADSIIKTPNQRTSSTAAVATGMVPKLISKESVAYR